MSSLTFKSLIYLQLYSSKSALTVLALIFSTYISVANTVFDIISLARTVYTPIWSVSILPLHSMWVPFKVVTSISPSAYKSVLKSALAFIPASLINETSCCIYIFALGAKTFEGMIFNSLLSSKITSSISSSKM